MKDSRFKPAFNASLLLLALAAIASAGGLFLDGLYRDNTLVTAAWRGNDFVTLVLTVPLLTGALVYARRGSQRAQLVWMGTVWYLFYNYAFYLFGAAFNRFFLLYVALLVLSLFTLITVLPRLDTDALRRAFQPTTPVKWIAGYMAFFAVLLGGMWIAQCAQFLSDGQVPQAIVQTGHPTGVVFALDLSLLVPSLLVGARLLWKRRAWGYFLASILMVKCTTYGLALIGMSAFADRAGVPDAWALAPLWAVLTAGALVAALVLFRNLRETTTAETAKPGAKRLARQH